MQANRFWRIWHILSMLIFVSLACSLPSGGGPPRNAAVVEVAANTALTPWLTAAVKTFNAAKHKTTGGKPAYINLKPVEAGQAVIEMTTGSALPGIWIPDSEVWPNILADRGQAVFQSDCVSTATSPLVIGMWRPIAESLGWPGRSLGWLDVSSLAADPSAWAYYSGGQFGPTLRMGHTHPGLSGSGAGTLLAIVQAAQSKADAVTVADIQQPIVQASVSAFEGTVSWFSADVASLGQTMRERGSGYLGAAVMYESTVVQYGRGQPEIVPIYPFEGTFVATHPACINGTLEPQELEVAHLFRDYLLSTEAQTLAVANGLRPVNTDVTVGAPLDAAHGVELDQPAIIFSSPTVETVYAIQDIWQQARKDVNLVMLLDTSGSMQGNKIDSVRQAAAQFVGQMGQDDFLTLIVFSDSPVVLLNHARIGEARPEAIRMIEQMQATGNTALYDAIGNGASVIAQTNSSETSNVMVVLTDGQDTGSRVYRFDDRLIADAVANDTTVFAIAYGRDADEKLLGDLAQKANGNYYEGNEANISAIYQEMSAAFGGSAGIGR